MLALARTPRQVAFQTWFLGELVHQAEGEPRSAWTEPAGTDGNGARRSSVS